MTEHLDAIFIHNKDEATLPEYTGTTDGDRALYLRANSHALATEAVTDARQQRADQLINDPDSVMSKVNAQRVGRQILQEGLDAARPNRQSSSYGCISDPAKFMADLQRKFDSPTVHELQSAERDHLVEMQGAQVLFDTAPEVAKYLSDMQRADEMATTREQRVGEAVDAAWPTEEDMREVDAMKAEYEASREDTGKGFPSAEEWEEAEFAARCEAFYPVPDNAAE